MEKKKVFKITFATILFLAVIGVVIYLILTLTGVGVDYNYYKKFAGPDAPKGQSIFIAQRISDDKWQVIVTPNSTDQPYYIMYNPTVSNDPTLTVFSSEAGATTYLKDAYDVTKKLYSAVSSANRKSVFKNFTIEVQNTA